MMKKAKKVIAKTAGKAFVSMAEVFATIPCLGRMYEPKMPDKLKK